MDNKNIFASNLKKYMKIYDKSRNDISEALSISYFTVSDWVNGKKYPRMDKVELLANYFGILKSDLIEDKPEQHLKMQKKNDVLSDIILKLNENAELLSITERLSKLDSEKLVAFKSVLDAFSVSDK